MKWKLIIALLIGLCLGLTPASKAYDIELWEDHPIFIHGSFGQGFVWGENDWLEFESRNGSLELNDLALNGTIVLNDSMTLGMQLLSRDFHETGNNKLEIDWLILDYSWKEWMGFRLGRLKNPMGLYAELWDLDVTRNTVFLPIPYQPGFRDLFSGIDGVSIYGDIPLGKLGSMSYTLAVGDKEVDKDGSIRYFAESGGIRSPNPYKVNDYVFAGRVIWNTPIEGLRLSTSIHQIKDASTTLRNFSVAAVPGLKVNYYYEMYRSVFFSLEYTRGNTVIACEMRDETQIETIPVDFVHQRKGGGREMYIQVDHRWNSWFATAIGYGVMWHNKEDFFKFHTDDFSGYTDTYFSARFDFTSWWFLTAQISYARDGRLYIRNNVDKFGNDNTRDNHWMFMMKTTVYF